MKKELLLSALPLLCSTLVLGQGNEVIPPSPVTREFTKYITQEVSLYNGIPEINIPLYTISVKGLNIPINLSYHASGIKYGQDDGSVGVGWVLNPGYRISRTVHGYPDELESMPSDILTTVSNYESNASGGNTPAMVERDQYLSKFVPGTQFNFGRLDGQYDQFTFSLPTAGGGFIITDRTNKTIATTETSNLLFDYTTGASACSNLTGIKGFQVTDDTGNKYAFGDYNTQTNCHIETASNYYESLLGTAWGLTDIRTPTGDEVSFSYDRRVAGEFVTHMRTYTIVETSPAATNCVGPTTDNEDYFTGHGYHTFYPVEINSPNEKVVFHYIEGQINQGMVWKVEILSPANEHIKTIEFFYSDGTHHTFLDHIIIRDKNHNEVETYRFEYYAKDIQQVFSMDHYGNYLPASFPIFYHQQFMDDPVIAATPDEYGAYNCHFYSHTVDNYMSGLGISREPSSSEFAPPDYFMLKKITYPTGGYTEYEYEHGKYGDPEHAFPVKNAGIRVKAIKSFDGVSASPITKRIKYGLDENGFGQPYTWVLNMEQLFVRESLSVGQLMGDEITGYLPQHRVAAYSTTMQGDIGVVFNQSGFVRYPCVTEYYFDAGPSTGNGKTVYFFDVGNMFDIRSLEVRKVIPREAYINGTPQYVYRYRLWDNPVLQRKVAYAYKNEAYIPVHEQILNYDHTSTTYAGIKVEQSVSRGDNELNVHAYAPSNTVERYFNYGPYYIEVGKNTLTGKTEHQYRDGNTITTNYAYEYSNLLPAKETASRSTGDDVVVHTAYPKDYAAGTGFIDNMIQNNLIALPIEQVKYIDDGTNKKILSGQITKYKTGGKGLKEQELLLETASPILAGSFKFSNRATGLLPPAGTKTTFSPDGQYKPRVNYDAYDSKGNILRASQQDGTTTSYVWGYDQIYPVAKVVNAIHDPTGIDNSSGTTVYTRVNEVYHENFEEHTNRLLSAATHTGHYIYQGSFTVELRDKIPGTYRLTYWSSPDKLVWTKNEVEITVTTSSTGHTIGGGVTYLDDIRLHPLDAQMSTYTYDPLVGMTSQTDAAGVATYYEYDAFGRLKVVKDHEKNILQHVDYNYKD